MGLTYVSYLSKQRAINAYVVYFPFIFSDYYSFMDTSYANEKIRNMLAINQLGKLIDHLQYVLNTLYSCQHTWN